MATGHDVLSQTFNIVWIFALFLTESVSKKTGVYYMDGGVDCVTDPIGVAKTLGGATVYSHQLRQEKNSHYGDNIECRITFQTEHDGWRLMLRVVDLDIPDRAPYAPYLCKDALYIYNTDSIIGTPMKEAGGNAGLCGRKLPPVLYSTGPYLTIYFRSDRDGKRGRGFQLVITAFSDDIDFRLSEFPERERLAHYTPAPPMATHYPGSPSGPMQSDDNTQPHKEPINKTIQEGQQALVLTHLGEGKIVEGPARITKFRRRIQLLKSCLASQDEYLVIKNKDGIISHMPGPCQVFNNPLEFDYIDVKKAIRLDGNHMIVVYRKEKDKSVTRRVVEGPDVFIPAADEWLHEFIWHGADNENKGHVIPGKDKFQQLTKVPTNFYYDVRNVRTNDDVMITVKLMLFYELKDLILMLEATKDPIADMMNAVCADMISFVGKIGFDQFGENTVNLNHLDTYQQLTQRAKAIGYSINRVVYRGYVADGRLAQTQGEAIHSRTQLRLNTEIEEQQQKLRDFCLQQEQSRTKLRQQVEGEKLLHEQKMASLSRDHDLAITSKEYEEKLKLNEMEEKSKLEYNQAEKELDAEFLEELRTLGVDVTAYLSLKSPKPVYEEIHISSASGDNGKS